MSREELEELAGETDRSGEIDLVGTPARTNWHYLWHYKGIDTLIVGERTVVAS